MKDKITPNIIDNSPNRELIRVLKDQLKKSKEAKFAIGYFSLSGFSLVKDDFTENYEKTPFLKIVAIKRFRDGLGKSNPING